MAIREIIILPDKQLRLVSKPVEKVTAEVRRVVQEIVSAGALRRQSVAARS